MRVQEYILECTNLLFACAFLFLFSLRIVRIRHLSETTRFKHLFPWCRAVFVLIFVVVDILQIVSMFVLSEWDWEYPIPWMVLGTTLNSIILILELFLLRLQILKQRPYTPVHRFYWIYLPLVSLGRLVLTIVPFQSIDPNQRLQQIILSSITFADSLFLCLYSLFLKRQEIDEFQDNSLFVFDNLRNNLLRGEVWINAETNTNRERVHFPDMLKAEVQVISGTEICVRTYSQQKAEAKKYVTIDSLSEFYTTACKFDLESKLDFEEIQFKLDQLQAFVSELLGDWRNYQHFVLEFLGLEDHRIKQIVKKVQQFKAKSTALTPAPMDPFCTIMNINITKALQIRNHYQFFIQAETLKGQLKRQVHKRYTQIEELDKKLKSLEIRSGLSQIRLRMPDFPQKYYLNLDEQSIDERRGKLETYLRRVCNDRIIMCKYRQSSCTVLEFLGFPDPSMHLQPLTPMIAAQPVTCQSLSISKMIINDRPATFYTFLIQSTPARKICKRYSDFEELQRELKRWMHNTQVEFKSIVLPAKRIKNMSEKDKQVRHRQLTNYLNMVMGEVKGVEECYEWRVFLGHEDHETEHSVVRSEVKMEAVELSNRSARESWRSSRGLSSLIENLGESTSKKY